MQSHQIMVASDQLAEAGGCLEGRIGGDTAHSERQSAQADLLHSRDRSFSLVAIAR